MLNVISLTFCSSSTGLTCDSTYTFVPIVLMVSGVLAAVAITAFVMIVMCCMGAGGVNSSRRVAGSFY